MQLNKKIDKNTNISTNIDIVSISTPCTFEENEQIKKILIDKNFNPNFYNQKNVSISSKLDNHFAICDPLQRFKNFKDACENKDSDFIWCNRGGYGSADILPFLRQMPKPKKSKILIGFSDVVSVATYIQQNWGWQLICAPMLFQILNNKVSKESQQIIFEVVAGGIKEINYDLRLLKEVKNEGVTNEINAEIVGGCVSVLSSNYATSNQLKWHNKILFLEDEGEDGERLERYFTQIANMINEGESKPSAILLGNFLENNEFGFVNSGKIDFAIKSFCNKLNQIPIYQEISGSLGHSFYQKPLFLGIKTLINANNRMIQKLI